VNRRVVERLWDAVWPHVDRDSPSDKVKSDEKRRLRIDDYRAAVTSLSSRPSKKLDGYSKRLEGLLTVEDERRSSIDTRLTGIIGLSSVAGAIVVAIIASASNLVLLQAPVREAIYFLLFYMVAQLLLAVRASLKGLGLRGYLNSDVSDVLPKAGEASADWAMRRMTSHVECLDDHREINNDKGTQLSVAYCGLRNFVWSMLLLSGVLAGDGIARNISQYVRTGRHDLRKVGADHLRREEELHERLPIQPADSVRSATLRTRMRDMVSNPRPESAGAQHKK